MNTGTCSSSSSSSSSSGMKPNHSSAVERLLESIRCEQQQQQQPGELETSGGCEYHARITTNNRNRRQQLQQQQQQNYEDDSNVDSVVAVDVVCNNTGNQKDKVHNNNSNSNSGLSCDVVNHQYEQQQQQENGVDNAYHNSDNFQEEKHCSSSNTSNNNKRKRKRKNKNNLVNHNNPESSQFLTKKMNHGSSSSSKEKIQQQQEEEVQVLDTVDSVQTMDATTYLRYVKQQAELLPDVFIANPITTSTSTTSSTNLTFDDKTNRLDSCDSKSCRVTQNKNNNMNHGKNHLKKMLKQQKQKHLMDPVGVVLAGCAASAMYLTSNRTALLPPPTLQHLPQENVLLSGSESILDHQSNNVITCTNEFRTENHHVSSSYCQVWVKQTLETFDHLHEYLLNCRQNQLDSSSSKSKKTSNGSFQNNIFGNNIMDDDDDDSVENDDESDYENVILGTTTTTAYPKTPSASHNSHADASHHTFPTMTRKIPVPKLKDHDAWYVFCFGEQSISLSPSSEATTTTTTKIPATGSNSSMNHDMDYYQDDYDDDTILAVDHDNPKNEMMDNEVQSGGVQQTDPVHNATTTTTTTEWVADHHVPVPRNGHTPTVPLLLQMDQVMVRKLLNHVTHYVVQFTYNQQQNILQKPTEHQTSLSSTSNFFSFHSFLPYQVTLWLYGLLSKLEKPIHRDDGVTLYTLLKQLTLLRSRIKFFRDDTTITSSTVLSPPPTSSPTTTSTTTATSNECAIPLPLNTPTIVLTSIDEVNVTINSDNDNGNKLLCDDNTTTHATTKQEWVGVQKKKQEEYVASLNTLIVIIGIYFEQGGSYKVLMQVS